MLRSKFTQCQSIDIRGTNWTDIFHGKIPMDTTTRLIIKSVTWQIAGLLSMTLIGFLFTGSFAASSGIAIVGSTAGFISSDITQVTFGLVRIVAQCRQQWKKLLSAAI